MTRPAPFKCPCCGQVRDGIDPYRLVDFLPITGIRRAVLRTLAANFGRYVPTSVVAERIYASVRDGGPETAEQCVKVHTFELRKLLKPYGLTIVGKRQDGGSHCLDWIDAPAVLLEAA